MEFLQAGLQLADQGIASATRNMYDRIWREFRGRPPLANHSPADHVIAYIAFLHFERRLSATTVRTYISALAYHHKLAIQPDPTTDFRVTQALRGLLKAYPRHPDTRSPITTDDLELLILALARATYSSYEARLFEAAFRLCFAACLRAGELQECIFDGDVSILSDRAVSVTLHSAKANKGRSERITLGDLPPDSPLVAALQAYMALRPRAANPRTCFFRHANGAPLKKSHFDGVLRRALVTARITKKITAHSFRIGGATRAARSGMSEADLLKLGRWKSKGVMSRYVRM